MNLYNTQIILDIGCGQKKIEGAIGIDFSPFSMADIVLDLNVEKLPFDDNSVDYIYTSHALEHLTHDGFINMINEMYRVAKPDSQIYITVPYFQNTVNFANPFHNNQICFNEHTFRFFSSAQECEALEKFEYETPSLKEWGLRYSANAELAVELETLKIDFTYFEQYEKLSYEDKFYARISKLNVIENITYWLKVIKPAPLLISKQSKYEISHVDEITKQIEFMKSQLDYIRAQEQHFINHQIKCDLLSYQRSLPAVVFIGGGLFTDSKGIIYPSVDIFWQYHKLIQLLREVTDKYQNIIDQHL